MSQIYSDNFKNNHPKPFQEFERNPDDSYNDWADEAAVIAAVELAYRPNKYFWIAGVLKQCDNDGTTFRTVSSSATTDYYDATAGTTIVISALIGRTITGPILRGGIGTGRLITTGSPTGNQIKFISSTGALTVHSDVPFLEGEELTITSI